MSNCECLDPAKWGHEENCQQGEIERLRRELANLRKWATANVLLDEEFDLIANGGMTPPDQPTEWPKVWRDVTPFEDTAADKSSLG